MELDAEGELAVEDSLAPAVAAPVTVDEGGAADEGEVAEVRPPDAADDEATDEAEEAPEADGSGWPS